MTWRAGARGPRLPHARVIWLLGGLLLLGCGSRSSLGGSGTSRRDGAPPGDGPFVGDAWAWGDRARADACLPIPTNEVRGSYEGKWSGSWSCPGQPAQGVSGTLFFSLHPTGSPNAFNVQGAMSGMVQGSFPFFGDIQGSMGCTALSATLPRILVGSGALVYELSGTLVGAFQASPRGFPGGTWTAKQKNGSCTAGGTWTAYWTKP